jgi:hypothetical protein
MLIPVMRGIYILLIEIRIWLPALPGGDGGDGSADVSDGAGDRSASKNMAKGVLYMLKNFHFNSGDLWYTHSVDTDLYLAGCASGWGWL